VALTAAIAPAAGAATVPNTAAPASSTVSTNAPAYWHHCWHHGWGCHRHWGGGGWGWHHHHHHPWW
jgi:Spy/CpxP family protein refolding chaperone